MIKNSITIGEPKLNKKTGMMTKPKKKFRVLIQERKSQGSKIERMNSFMIYDYKGESSMKSITQAIQKKVGYFINKKW